MKLEIILADDHVLVREGLKALLEQYGFSVIGEASNGHEAIRLNQQLHPDIIVLDLAMPLLNGLDAAKAILQESPLSRIILLSMYSEDRYVFEALRIGIRGYIIKSSAAANLVEAIREVSCGNIYLSPRISRAVVEAFLSKTELPPDPLSPRERQVLQLIAEGKSTKEIANHLGISFKTAETHRTNLMNKLDIHDTAGLVIYAIRQGLVHVDIDAV